MTNAQANEAPCERCGHLVPVVRASAYEFDLICTRCGHWSSVSWAHSSAPPDFREPCPPPDPEPLLF